ncbi:O-antigen ligase family protein [Aeromonas jandaei]|uniref:O-antigen ligase family protein n=1 Tax=Aeromonas jandaei TaxID=650 RepID=UPI003F793890
MKFLNQNIIYLPFLLIFLGELKVPVGGSTFSLPLSFITTPFLISGVIANKKYIVDKLCLIFSFIALLGFASILYNPVAEFSRGLVGMLPVIYMIMMLFSYAQVNLDEEVALKYLTVGVMLLSIQIYIDFIHAQLSDGDYYEKKLFIETWLGRSNFLAAFLIFSLGLIKRNVFVFVFISMAVFATMSRGGALIMLVMYLIMALYYINHKASMTVKYFIFIVFCLVSLVFIFIIISHIDFFKSFDFRSVFNRFDLWFFSIELYSDNLALGIGPNSFRTYVESTHGIEDVWGTHNSILQILLNYGFLGCVFYLYFFYKIWEKASKGNYSFLTSIRLKSMLISIFLFSLFEPLIGSGSFEVLLVLGYLIIRERERKRTFYPDVVYVQ